MDVFKPLRRVHADDSIGLFDPMLTISDVVIIVGQTVVTMVNYE
jgi:hypothetical protein